MLHVFFGDMDNAIYNTAVFFKNDYEDEWIVDPFVKEMIREGDAPQRPTRHDKIMMRSK